CHLGARAVVFIWDAPFATGLPSGFGRYSMQDRAAGRRHLLGMIPVCTRQPTYVVIQALSGCAATSVATTRSLAFLGPRQAPTGPAFDITTPFIRSKSIRGWSCAYPLGAVLRTSWDPTS